MSAVRPAAFACASVEASTASSTITEIFSSAIPSVRPSVGAVALRHRLTLASTPQAKAAAVFTEKELAQVIAMAVTINAWNR